MAAQAGPFLQFKTAADRRALLNQDIKITMRSGTTYTGRFIEMSGRNMLIDMYGANDWIWVPDISRVEVATT